MPILCPTAAAVVRCSTCGWRGPIDSLPAEPLATVMCPRCAWHGLTTRPGPSHRPTPDGPDAVDPAAFRYQLIRLDGAFWTLFCDGVHVATTTTPLHRGVATVWAADEAGVAGLEFTNAFLGDPVHSGFWVADHATST